MKRIAIVGGGIAGLTLAYRLQGRVEVTLVESRPRLGGVIATHKSDGWVVEGGPDSFLAAKVSAMELCAEVGLAAQLQPARARSVLIYSRGRMYLVRMEVLLARPVSLALLSPAGRLRMAMDLVCPRRRKGGDESLGAFFRRRMGREVVEKIADPLLGGIHLASADRLSLWATFPRLGQLERERRSLILALRRAPSVGGFVALRGGMEDLVQAVASRLRDVRVVCGTPVAALEPGFQLHLPRETIRADGVVLACPAPVAAALVGPFAPQLACWLQTIPVHGSATVSLGYRVEDLPALPEASGFVVVRRDRHLLQACTLSSSKFEGRAPPGHVLLRCFFGGAGDPQAVERSDAQLVAQARQELERLMGITAPPCRQWVFRWPQANPLYEVGHLDRVATIERTCPPGLWLVGSSYRGIGIPDGVRCATELAARVVGNW